ncbi:hypothetical protein NLJ89_g2123 [Agrocybe chaxingu]|uniref:Uncharacterized protein n=1 Tax=Agrocybe chaxingu TaxID=84603 RepID=A0A9W8K785_9AGAR|nr:hypothetical protein NLJ89_g2123 [Agrocybe chaxingu]
MSMSLKRVGGKEDGGVDLVGWWWLPHETSSTSSSSPPSTAGRRRLRVIGQCKAEKKKMGPNYVRELEGVSYGLLARGPTVFPFPSSDNENGAWTEFGQDSSIPLVALLISQSAFTKSTILRAHSSSIPFFLLHLPSVEGTPVNVEEAEDGDSRDVAGNLGSVYCNSALSGMQGLLKGYMEVRWERHFSGESGRPALWWKDKRLQSWTPDHPPLVERMG